MIPIRVSEEDSQWLESASKRFGVSISTLMREGARRYVQLAQQQLGHSTLSTTADIYTSVDEEQVTETAEALGKAFCGRSVVETPCVSNSVN